MNDNRLEDSRLDADHIDRLTRELAAMRSRAEKAEADIEAYMAREVAVNTWGVLLCDRLGDFLRQTADASGPMTTKIIVSFEGGELPVVHLWATTDGQNPAARCADLRERLNDALQRAEQAEARNISANPWPWRNWRK